MICSDEQCINHEETDEDQRKPKKITNIPENLAVRSHMVALQRRQCSAIFVGRRQTSLHRQRGEPLMFGLEPTEELVHVRPPAIN